MGFIIASEKVVWLINTMETVLEYLMRKIIFPGRYMYNICPGGIIIKQFD